MEEVKEYYLGIDNNFEYFIEETNYDELLGWNNFYIIRKNYKKDEDEFDSYKEKFNFNAKSDDGFTLKSFIQLHNNNLSREDRFSLVEIGKSIEALITVHKMCEFGCNGFIYMNIFPEENKILKDEPLKKRIEKKIWKLWNLAVKILEKDSTE